MPGPAQRGSFLQARCDQVLVTNDWCLPLAVALLLLLLVYAFIYLPSLAYRNATAATLRVDEAVKFPGLPPRRQLTYQAKQTISREMEQEKMRRAEQLMLLRNPVAAPKEKATSSTRDPKRSQKNHQQRLENIVKQATVEIRPELDFFGRTVAPKPQRPLTSETGERTVEQCMGTAVGNSHVWFRFNEGVSNAVRRNVYIRELL
ncbi:hypothetical protein CRUP_008786 [Coryphaenoides rupestris]|nr:hypothetical protein CRUP_008786 [Coryphaenoides rupestris]